MNWIILYLAQRDNVYFITSSNSEKDFLKYHNFIKYVNTEFKIIINYIDFIDALNKFKVILLYENGVWEIIEEELNQNVSFKQLYELNNTKDKSNKNKQDLKIEASKNLIKNISDAFRKKQNTIKK